MKCRGGQCKYVGLRLEPTRLAQQDLLRASDSKSPAPSFFLRVSLTLRDLDVTVILFTIQLNRFKLVTVERYVGSFRLALHFLGYCPALLDQSDSLPSEITL